MENVGLMAEKKFWDLGVQSLMGGHFGQLSDHLTFIQSAITNKLTKNKEISRVKRFRCSFQNQRNNSRSSQGGALSLFINSLLCLLLWPLSKSGIEEQNPEFF